MQRLDGPVLRETLLAALDGEDFHISGGLAGGARPSELLTSETGSKPGPTPLQSGSLVPGLNRHRISLEEMILGLYHAESSVANAEQLARSLFGEEATLAVVSECGRKTGARIREWLNRNITAPQKFVLLQTMKLKLKTARKAAAMRVAIGIHPDGIREALAVSSDFDRGNGDWEPFLQDLKGRGLKRPELFLGENSPGEYQAIKKIYPQARYQIALPSLARKILAQVPVDQIPSIAATFQALKVCRTRKEAGAKITALIARLRSNQLAAAAESLQTARRFLFHYLDYPPSSRQRLIAGHRLNEILGQLRRQIRLVGPFHDDETLQLLVGARLRFASRVKWARHRYITMHPDKTR